MMKKMIIVSFLFLIGAGCSRNSTKDKKKYRSSQMVDTISYLYNDSITIMQGYLLNEHEIGAWRHNDIKGNPLVRRQYSPNSDSTSWEYLSKYYSGDGRILIIEKMVNNKIVYTDYVTTNSNDSLLTNSSAGILFKEYCAECHTSTTDLPLAYIEQKRTWTWLSQFITNGSQMAKEGDTIAIRLQKENRNIEHRSFPFLSDDDIHAILSYLNSDSTVH